MAVRIPYAWLVDACRTGDGLRRRAALLEDAVSSLTVIGVFGAALAYALSGGALAWALAVTPLLLAIWVAVLAWRARRRVEAHERDIAQVLACPGSRPAAVHRLRGLRLAPSRPHGESSRAGSAPFHGCEVTSLDARGAPTGAWSPTGTPPAQDDAAVGR
jgi:hypothetical protein